MDYGGPVLLTSFRYTTSALEHWMDIFITEHFLSSSTQCLCLVFIFFDRGHAGLWVGFRRWLLVWVYSVLASDLGVFWYLLSGFLLTCLFFSWLPSWLSSMASPVGVGGFNYSDVFFALFFSNGWVSGHGEIGGLDSVDWIEWCGLDSVNSC
ncbi:hypothetical protein BDD12DRAFT_247299 [Trichophaea hybrida]|nr:hypothetical protein BDD12DRAFT_247299 [Trichophaea hybrida]